MGQTNTKNSWHTSQKDGFCFIIIVNIEYLSNLIFAVKMLYIYDIKKIIIIIMKTADIADMGKKFTTQIICTSK